MYVELKEPWQYDYLRFSPGDLFMIEEVDDNGVIMHHSGEGYEISLDHERLKLYFKVPKL